MNKLWFGDDLSEAVNEPRLHMRIVPDQIVFYENNTKYRIDKYVIEGLTQLGHNVTGSDCLLWCRPFLGNRKEYTPSLTRESMVNLRVNSSAVSRHSPNQNSLLNPI